MNKSILLLSVFVAGCCVNPPVVLPDAVPASAESPVSGKKIEAPKQTVQIDPYLLKKCKALEILYDNPTPENVLAAKRNDVLAHSDCSSRQAELVKIVKDAFNIR